MVVLSSDSEKAIDILESVPRPKKLLGFRHVQVFMLFSALVVAYGIRTNMSVGIIAMMSDKPPNPDIPTYPKWTEKDTILSSFFWGYVIPQIGAGQLVKKFGPKWFLGAAILVNGLFSILIPVLAASRIGAGGVILCRVIQGFTQGFVYPSIHNLLGRWTPIAERSTLGSFAYVGGALGTVISLPVTGFISDSSVGWPTAFYLYGGFAAVWFVIWAWVGSNSPSTHSRISEEERNYIENTSGGSSGEKQIPTPWKSIFTSVPFLAIFVAHSGQNWGFWTLLTETPSYIHNIMGYDLSKNSLLSALPYLVLLLLSFVTSPLCDFMITRHYLSIGNARKLFHTIGVCGPAIALIALAFVDEKFLAIVLLVIAVGLNSATYCSFLVNHIDLSPNHSGTLMGITNGISNIFSILAPLTVQWIGISQTDPRLWRIVFLLAAGIYIATDIFYVIFASGEIQPWNDLQQNSEEKKMEKMSNDCSIEAVDE